MILTLITFTFLVSVLLTRYFTRPDTFLYIVDEPNHRSLHTRPIPVSGGVAILIAFTLSMTVACWYDTPPSVWGWINASGLLIAMISFWDDCRHVPVLYRLTIHFFAACLLLWQTDFWLTQLDLPGILWTLPIYIKMTCSVLFVVWMVNLYNFMDGMDGFAGGMAVFGFSTLAILGGLAEQSFFMLINLIIASAAAGFLIFNFPPAKIFMGDVGASSLGFLVAIMSLWGHHDGIFPLWVAMLIFSPFIVDATITLCRRLRRGEKVWLAHRSHYYQRLVQLGWGHRRTVLWEYVLMIGCSLCAILAPFLSVKSQWGILIFWGVVYVMLMYLVHRLERGVVDS